MVLNWYFEYSKVGFCSANRTNFYRGKFTAFATCPQLNFIDSHSPLKLSLYNPHLHFII